MPVSWNLWGVSTRAGAQSLRAAEVWLRVHGGPEWRDDAGSASSNTRAPVAPTNTVVLLPEEIPEIVHRLLVERRLHSPDAPDIVEMDEPPRVPSRSSLVGLAKTPERRIHAGVGCSNQKVVATEGPSRAHIAGLRGKRGH